MTVLDRNDSDYAMKAHDAPVIEVVGFAKNYGDFPAVRELSFTVRLGEIVGLVGANGAGKTTTLRAITGILRPTLGTIRVGGCDLEHEPVSANDHSSYTMRRYSEPKLPDRAGKGLPTGRSAGFQTGLGRPHSSFVLVPGASPG